MKDTLRWLHQTFFSVLFFEMKMKYLVVTLPKKWGFSLRISIVDVTKSAGNYKFGHIYWRNR